MADDINTDLDDEFNEADFFEDFDPPEAETTGRKPASGKAQSVTAGLLSGGTGFAKSVAQEINNSLPRTNVLVGDAMNVANEFKALGQDFNKELGPTINSVKRAMAKSLPMAQKFIPAKLYNSIENKVKDFTEEQRGPSKEELQGAAIAESIGSIFASQEAIRAEERTEARTTQLVDRVLDGSRADREQEALISISNKLLYQNQFISSTQTAWMKKMLELKYIHVYTAKEHLATSKVLASITETKLEEIKHNTSLPDVIKVRKNEALKANLRGRAIDKFGDFAGNYIKNTSGNILNTLREKGGNFMTSIKDTAGMVGDAGEMVEGARQMAEEIGEEGPDLAGKNAAAKGIGGLTGKFLGTRAGRRFAEILAPVLNKVEDTAGNLKTNIAFKGQSIREKLEGRGGILGPLIAQLIPEFANDKTLKNGVLDDPEGATSFDNMTRHTIVEIIPGYLSRMTKHLNDLVNGEDNAEIKYDVVKGGFRTKEEVRTSGIERAFGNTKERSQEILETLGSIKGSFIATNGEESAADFDLVRDDIIRFITNSALNIATLNPDAIKEFADSGIADIDNASGYIQKNFKGLKFPREAAMVLTAALFIDDELNNNAFKQIQNVMRRAVSAENWKDMMPKLIKSLGQQDIFSDALNDDQTLNVDFLLTQMMDIDLDRKDNEVNEASDTFQSELQRRRERDEDFKDMVDGLIPERMKGFMSRTKEGNKGLLGELAGLFDGEDIKSLSEKGFKFTKEQLSAIGVKAGDLKDTGMEKVVDGYNVTTDKIAEAKEGGLASKFNVNLAQQAEARRARGGGFLGPLIDELLPEFDNKLNVAKASDTVKDNFSKVKDVLEVAKEDITSGSILDEKSSVAQNVRLVGFSHTLGQKFDSFTMKICDLVDKAANYGMDVAEDMATAGGPPVEKETSNTFHQDVLAFAASNSAENALILDAILSGGKGGKGVLKSMGGSLARGGKNVLDMYTNIYGQMIKGGTELGKGAMELGGKALPMIGRGAGAALEAGKFLGGKTLDLYSNIYGKSIDAGGGALKALFTRKGAKVAKKQDTWVDIYRKDKVEPGYPLASIKQQKEDTQMADGSTAKASIDFTKQPCMDINTAETLITAKDIEIGLVDIHGNPIGEASASGKGFMGKLMGAGKSILKGGKDLLGDAMGMYGKIYSKIFEKASDGIGGVFKWITGKGKQKGSKDIVERLDTLINITKARLPEGGAKDNYIAKIHDILNIRLPKGSEDDVPFDDADGDGDRDGSYKDQAKELAKGKDKKFKPGMKGPKGGTINKNGDEVDSDGNILTTAANLLQVGSSAKAGLSKMSRLHKIGKAGKLGSLGKMGKAGQAVYNVAGKAKGLAGSALRGGGSLLARGGGALLRGGAMLGTALMGTSAGAAVASGGAAIAAGAGSAMTATAGVLAAIPVAGWIALGVLAVGAAGWGIWNATKTTDGGKDLAKIRLKAYGLPEDFDVDELEDFEEDLADIVEDGDELDLEDFTGDNFFSTNWMGMFGLNKKDPDQLKYFGTWMAKRAIPVFAVISGVTKANDIDYNSLDSLDSDDPKFEIIKIQLEQQLSSINGADMSLTMTKEGFEAAKSAKEDAKAAREQKAKTDADAVDTLAASLGLDKAEGEAKKTTGAKPGGVEGEEGSEDGTGPGGVAKKEGGFLSSLLGGVATAFGMSPLGKMLQGMDLGEFFPAMAKETKSSEMFGIRSTHYKANGNEEALLAFEEVAVSKFDPSLFQMFAGTGNKITAKDIDNLGKALGIDMYEDDKAAIHLNKWVRRRFEPLFKAYLAIIKAANYTYDELEDPEDHDPTEERYLGMKKKVIEGLAQGSSTLPDIGPVMPKKDEEDKKRPKGAGGINEGNVDALLGDDPTKPDPFAMVGGDGSYADPAKSNVDNYAPTQGVNDVDKEMAKAKLDTAKSAVDAAKAGPDENLEVANKALKATEEQNEKLDTVASALAQIAGNTGELGGIKSGLDKNLKEATKPSVIQHISQATTTPRVVKPTLNVAKA